MPVDVKTELQIPDFWFDFYARVIPGAAFVGAARYWWMENYEFPSATESAVLLAVGYFVGLLVQPVGSTLTETIETIAAKRKGKDYGYVGRAKVSIGSRSGLPLILDKMHGETTMYVQLGLLVLVFWGVDVWKCARTWPWYGFAIAAVLFGAMSWEVTSRRLRRAMAVAGSA